MTARPTQCGLVLGLLTDGAWHSTLEIIGLGVLRPAARIFELRDAGEPIECRQRTLDTVTGKVQVYEYRHAGDPFARAQRAA